MNESDSEDTDHESLRISAVLEYCKNKILHPYLRLLSTIGLRPVCQEYSLEGRCGLYMNYLYFILVFLLLNVAYILQGLSCFRRDRGFYYKVHRNLLILEDYKQICYGSLPFSYVIPSILHLSAYLYALYLFRLKENEQLQNLMERVFLLTSSNADGAVQQKHLLKKLWLFVILSVLWMTLSVVSVAVMMADGSIIFHWFEKSAQSWTVFMKCLLILGTIWHDLVEVTLTMSYCLQAQLLTSYLTVLRAKLMEHTMSPLDWIREIGAFQKLLEYFNNEFSPCVNFLTIVNITWAISGIMWLLHLDRTDTDTVSITGISVLNVLLWVCISTVPFIQAARLTSSCQIIRNLGHEIRGRPFVYVDTPGDDLDTILLYTSSLQMTARLFEVPIKGQYLFSGLALVAVIVLTLGQCHIIN